MKKGKGRSMETIELRRRAEESLREKTTESRPPRTEDEIQKLLHELQVHQVELELQNEELRQARDEMEAALEKYTDLYDFAPVGYMTLDGAGAIRSINLTGAGLLGVDRCQLIGRRFDLFVAAQSRAPFHAFLRQVLASQGQEACEIALPGNGKEPRIVRLEAVVSAAGEECRVAVSDISERKRVDEEIKRLNTTLERRADELEVVNQDLEAFSYTVSHDLRSPLTVISGYCQVVQQLWGDRVDEECRGYLQEIEQGILRMNGMIDTLLNFASLTRSELRSEPVDLSQMARAVAVQLGKENPERRVTFTVAPGVTAHGDPKLLRIALENLLGNAWKYTGKTEDAAIEFGMTQRGKKAFFVRDNGPGFDSAHADLLFRAFQRLPGTNEFGGLGIGLATVQRIIELHGGRAWAEGEVGKGATFFFTLA